MVTAEPGIRADIRPVPIAGGRPLRTLRGTLDEVIYAGEQAGDAYLRVILAEPARAGLGDLVRDKLPNALDVQLDDAHRPQPGRRGGARPSRAGRSPRQLFGDYLAEQNVDDPRIAAMFAELLDEITGAPGPVLARRDTEFPGPALPGPALPRGTPDGPEPDCPERDGPKPDCPKPDCPEPDCPEPDCPEPPAPATAATSPVEA